MNKSVVTRIDEFVNYHIHGDADCYGKILKLYANNENMTEHEVFDFVYFYSITYNIPSAIVLYKEREQIRKNPRLYATNNKDRILFQSDRKYVKIQDRYENSLEDWQKNINFEDFKRKNIIGNKINLNTAIKYVQKWFYFGRFASFLFLEGIYTVMDYSFENCKIKWLEGDTATSGVMNVFGYDKHANYFDKYNKIAEGLNINRLDSMLEHLEGKIKAKGGNYNTTCVETSLCAYRKFYKGTRYNGYYLDRQLEEIIYIENNYPQYKQEIEKIKAIRKQLFNPKYLGELNNWTGIRNDLKKVYILKGEIT